MQVKKFEAPTLQEALDHVKRELGPEAIILQTKKNKRGFGLMSKPSVEITAAISERSFQKMKYIDKRLPPATREAMGKLPAPKQAEFVERFSNKYIDKVAETTRDKVQISPEVRQVKVTGRKYIDITDSDKNVPKVEIDLDVLAEESVKMHAAAVGHKGTAPVAPKVAGQRPLSGMTVEEELQHLKRMVQEMKITQDDNQGPAGALSATRDGVLAVPALQDAFEQLVVNGVDKKTALALIKKIVFEVGEEGCRDPDTVADQMALEIMATTEVLSPLGGVERRAAPSENAKESTGPVAVALIGPTGVGKTTTIAKIASEAILKRSLKVGMIGLDCYKVGAFDQLGTYGKILNVPYRSVKNAEELRVALQDYGGLDLILIDTTGRSQKDPSALSEMQELLQSVPNIRSHLVLAATTRDIELLEMVKRFSIFRPIGLVFSKLDEASLYGVLYNIPQKVKLPLLYFTTGQKVPDDIEEATRERVAALTLGI